MSGPYKVGDEDSPRVPESSHPNCRCRRIKADKPEPYEFLDLSKNDSKTLRELQKRLDNVLKDYKDVTGIDIRKSIEEGKFSNRSRQPDDKTQFIKWLYHRVGYDKKPKKVKEFSTHEWFNKVSLDPKKPNYLDEPTLFYRGIKPTEDKSLDQIKQELFVGQYHPSGTFTSDWGRGTYVTKYRPTAERYAKKVGEVLELGIDKDVKIFVIADARKLTFNGINLNSRYKTDTHYDIIATLAGYDIVRKNKYAVELNVMNRGKLEWKSINTKNTNTR